MDPCLPGIATCCSNQSNIAMGEGGEDAHGNRCATIACILGAFLFFFAFIFLPLLWKHERNAERIFFSARNPRSKIWNPKLKIRNPQNTNFKIRILKCQIQNPQLKVRIPENNVQNPKHQNSKLKIQSLKSKSQNQTPNIRNSRLNIQSPFPKLQLPV